jgi:hypothetical protein
MIGSYVGMAFALAYSGALDRRPETDPDKSQQDPVRPAAAKERSWTVRRSSDMISRPQGLPLAR